MLKIISKRWWKNLIYGHSGNFDHLHTPSSFFLWTGESGSNHWAPSSFDVLISRLFSKYRPQWKFECEPISSQCYRDHRSYKAGKLNNWNKLWFETQRMCFKKFLDIFKTWLFGVIDIDVEAVVAFPHYVFVRKRYFCISQKYI